jgi:hypothetical protein
MKNTILTLLLALGATLAFAQENGAEKTTTAQNGQNEIRLNLLNTILGIPEISYERIFKDNTSAGLSVLVGVTDDAFEYNFGFTPYYRIYFSNSAKRATGLFIETNATLIGAKDTYYSYNSPAGSSSYWEENNVNFGLGAAVGGKLITKNGFVGEAYLGLGRFFGKNRIEDIYPRIGITIGKRF